MSDFFMVKKLKKSPLNGTKRTSTDSEPDEDMFNADFTLFSTQDAAPEQAESQDTSSSAVVEVDVLERVIQKQRELLQSLVSCASKDTQQPDDEVESQDADAEDNDAKDDLLDKSISQIDVVKPQDTDCKGTFTDFQLSRPLLKAISLQLGFAEPTPIQSAAIPVILSGRDVLGCAVTGSGKTAAFAIPIIERLLQAQIGSAVSAAVRVLVIVPTRELASQCTEVWRSLTHYTRLGVCLLAGGLSIANQEAELRRFPDIVVVTPGRLVDLLHNSSAINLDSIEVLILDEADRMLEDGFADELNFIIKSCPRQRQTILFSATLSLSMAVEGLARLSLTRPVQLQINSSEAIASKLTQEFIRVRSSKAEDQARDALLLSLIEILISSPSQKDTTVTGIMVFFPSKEKAHRTRVVLGLRGISSNELHGDLTQPQRTAALSQFKSSLEEGKNSILLCTDVAARGLDIPGVSIVINWSLPGEYSKYQHRIGRTARAGRSGRAISLVGESDRKVLKLAIKNGSDLVSQRSIPSEKFIEAVNWIGAIEDQIAQVLIEEREQKKVIFFSIIQVTNRRTRPEASRKSHQVFKGNPGKTETHLYLKI